MGGKRRKRNPRPDWAKEDLPPVGVVIQVYRMRRDDRKNRKYLGLVEPNFQIDLEDLEARHPVELDELIPRGEAQTRWGGGHYQFRFLWRDEEGKRTQKRSRDWDIAHPPPEW